MLSRLPLRSVFAMFVLLTAGLAAIPAGAGAATYASLDAGADHTCAIRPGGSVYCWGTGNTGQLGVIGQSRARTPVGVIGSYTALQVTSGSGWWCELRQGGNVACTGVGSMGQLGTGKTSMEQYPMDVIGLPTASRIEAGRQTACAITIDGLYCWGDSVRGQLGDGQFTFTPVPTPRKVPFPGTATDLAVGKDHVCAVRDDRRVLCWGDAGEGRLGTEQLAAVTVPDVPVTGITDAKQVVVGDRHSCALLQAGTVQCWGSNQFGQVGVPSLPATREPQTVPGLTGVTQIATANLTTCAVKSDGTVWCWGDGRLGELGNGGRNGSSAPVQVQGLPGNVTAVSTGEQHVCAITATLAPYCWGSNRLAQLGSGGIIGTNGIELTAQPVQDAVRGTASFLPTPITECDKTNRGGKVYLRVLHLTRRGSKCPARAEVTIRARGREVKRRVTDIEEADRSCTVTGLLDLPTGTQRAFSVVIVVRGNKLKTRKLTLRPRPNSA